MAGQRARRPALRRARALSVDRGLCRLDMRRGVGSDRPRRRTVSQTVSVNAVFGAHTATRPAPGTAPGPTGPGALVAALSLRATVPRTPIRPPSLPCGR